MLSTLKMLTLSLLFIACSGESIFAQPSEMKLLSQEKISIRGKVEISTVEHTCMVMLTHNDDTILLGYCGQFDKNTYAMLEKCSSDKEQISVTGVLEKYSNGLSAFQESELQIGASTDTTISTPGKILNLFYWGMDKQLAVKTAESAGWVRGGTKSDALLAGMYSQDIPPANEKLFVAESDVTKGFRLVYLLGVDSKTLHRSDSLSDEIELFFDKKGYLFAASRLFPAETPQNVVHDELKKKFESKLVENNAVNTKRYNNGKPVFISFAVKDGTLITGGTRFATFVSLDGLKRYWKQGIDADKEGSIKSNSNVKNAF